MPTLSQIVFDSSGSIRIYLSLSGDPQYPLILKNINNTLNSIEGVHNPSPNSSISKIHESIHAKGSICRFILYTLNMIQIAICLFKYILFFIYLCMF